MSSLSKLCEKLIAEGVSKKELNKIADDCDMGGYPGSLGDEKFE